MAADRGRADGPATSPVADAATSGPTRGVRMRLFDPRRLSDVWPPVATVALLIVAWEILVDVLEVPRFIVPAPSQVADVLVTRTDYLLHHAMTTAHETILGFGLSVLIGVPLGIVVIESRLFVRTIYPLIVASQAIPKLAVAPLFVIWFGFGLTPKILIAFLIAFFPIVIDTAVGLRSVPQDNLLLARSMGLGPIRTFTKVRMPHALPSTFGGLKIGISLAVVGAVVGEFLGSNSGLGYVLIVANGTLNTPLLFAALFGLSVLGLLAYAAVAVVERLAIPWHFEQPTTGTGH